MGGRKRKIIIIIIKAASSDGRALAYARTSKCAHVEMCIISFFITSVLITTRSFRQLS